MGAEDVRDLEGATPHGNLRRVRGLEGTDHVAQEVGGNLGIECCRFQLLVAEQDLDHADVDFLFEQVRGEAVAPIPMTE